MPRHPPIALKNLTTKIKDARVHCAVLKLRAVPAGLLRLPARAGSSKVQRDRRTSLRGKIASGDAPRRARRPGLHPLPQDPTVCHADPDLRSGSFLPYEDGVLEPDVGPDPQSMFHP